MTRRSPLLPLQTLYAAHLGPLVALPPRLARLYGSFHLRQGPVPWVYSNFVATLDGVVSLHVKGHAGGGDISGFSAQDRMVMGLLRAAADVVIVGGGTLAADGRRMWTPEAICPELAADYRRLVKTLRHSRPLLKVVVSASGALDLTSPAFAPEGGALLVLTNAAGAKRLARGKGRERVEIRAVRHGGPLAAAEILAEVGRRTPAERILVEGGPRLLATFYAARLIDEQFLTLAPQLAGRRGDDERPSLVMGRWFAPQDPRWAALADVRRGGNQLFLRYLFDRAPATR
jgi:riboflavin biosynthesis pyrimidine reductase